MKSLLYIFVFCFTFTIVEAQITKNNFLTHKTSLPRKTIDNGAITYIQASKSVNGPFSNPATIQTNDSLYLKMDCTPLGTVHGEYYLDVNQNNVIDTSDLQLGFENYIDNNTSPPNIIDFDPTAGVIIPSLKVEQLPSMHVIVHATEGVTSAEGILIFQNPPKAFTLSGYVHSTAGGVVPGEMVWVGDSSGMVGTADATDAFGHYSVPLDAGRYFVRVSDFGMARYTSFDTVMTISSNTVHDFYVSPLNSYIKGYVKDELSNPIANAEVSIQNARDQAITDANGMYKLMVSPGSGYLQINSQSIMPNYMSPQQHYFTIADNDSIVNNDTSNFTCYTANSSITGTVTENGSPATRTYMLTSWNYLYGSSNATTNVSGHYVLPVHNDMTMPTYNVFFTTWGGLYTFPPGMYPDTMYSNLSPGSVANFNFIPAETLFVDHFTGTGNHPGPMWWYYNYGSPWGLGAVANCNNDRLMVKANSMGGLSGLGFLTQKPFNIHNREFRIYTDVTSMGSATNNTVKIILNDQLDGWNYPQNFKNSLQLIWEKSPAGYRQWRLVKSKNGVFSDLCTSSDTLGYYILFQLIDPDTLRFKIGNTIYYNGTLGNIFSMAYFYVTEFNLYPDASTPVYFDELVIGPLGSTGVREVGGDLPTQFKLDQNFPNPFNPSTLIRYHIPASSQVTLKVFNTLGQEVSILVNELQTPGNYEVHLDAKSFPSGVYYYRLSATDVVSGRQMINDIHKALLVK